jgi:hypothetical protein
VADKFLGNLADTNGNLVLEPCTLGGLCEGRRPRTEPAVVEGSPPVPMVVRSTAIPIEGAPPDAKPPRIGVYPAPGAIRAHQDVVMKVFLSEPRVADQGVGSSAGRGASPSWRRPSFCGALRLGARELPRPRLTAGAGGCAVRAAPRCRRWCG